VQIYLHYLQLFGTKKRLLPNSFLILVKVYIYDVIGDTLQIICETILNNKSIPQKFFSFSRNYTMSTNLNINVSFEGWKTSLEPENFNLISILKFRRTKDDFSFNKSVEHTHISKFVSHVATTEERKWREVASALNVSKVPVILSSLLKRKKRSVREKLARG